MEEGGQREEKRGRVLLGRERRGDRLWVGAEERERERANIRKVVGGEERHDSSEGEDEQ